MRPVAFEGLSGWLHRRGGIGHDTGVVLISPLGRDQRCAHMPMRLFADRLAASGFPTLRYDHLGQGDSLAPPDAEGDALVLWLKGVQQAVALLREQTGVRRVVVGGVRLGATLAVLAAAQADGLMLLAPVLNGRSWVRRLRFSSVAADQKRRVVADDAPLDADGLMLSRATVARLSAIDLPNLALPKKKPVFLAAQNQIVDAYGGALSERGQAIVRSEFPGFDALFLDAHSNTAPEAVFEAAIGWLERTFPGLAPAEAASAIAAQTAQFKLQGAVERPVEFGGGLRGVLCEPDEPGADATAILFFNTGGDPRSGIGGFTTAVARQLAERGVASLRFDFAGLGDSPMPGGKMRSHIFETAREADFEAAVSLLALRGYSRIVTAGVCAGAYHAFRLAVNDPRVSGLFAVSPVKLVWRKGDSLAFGRKIHGKATHFYTRALAVPATWKRLAAREVDVGVVAATLAHRMTGRVLGMAAHLRGASPLMQMDAFSKRGGKACFLLGLDDASLDEMETYFGARASRLRRLPGTDVHVAPDMDHGLARSASRQIALKTLLDWLGLKDR